MKVCKHGFRRLLSLAPLALLAAGCATPEERFQQRSAARPAAYQALSSQDQARLRGGGVRPGDTKDAVWLARGDPTRIDVRVTPGHTNELWSYTYLIRQPRGLVYPYDAPRAVMLPNGGVAWVHNPLWHGGDSVREVEYLRVEFEWGRAVAVETPQPAP